VMPVSMPDVAQGCEATGCPNGMVCHAGACVTCMVGMACTPTNKCHAGLWSCTNGPECMDTGDPLPPGTSCGTSMVCNFGVCTACMAGGTCQPDNPCKTGTYSCSSGNRLCVEAGNKSRNVSCGAAQSCSNGTKVTAKTCDGAGKCTGGTSSSCAPYQCSGDDCASSCPANTCGSQCTVCKSTEWCDSGSCRARTKLGMGCSSSKECLSGNFCTDGVCCEKSSCPTCQSCANTTPGKCTNLARYQTDDESPGTCNGDSVCDGSGACKKGLLVKCPTASDSECASDYCAGVQVKVCGCGKLGGGCCPNQTTDGTALCQPGETYCCNAGTCDTSTLTCI
jgi:hypothetical protein